MLDARTPVLILDGYASTRSILRGMLQHVGLRNINEDDGPKALELLSQQGFGLVISDLVLTPISGLELLRRVLNDPRRTGMPSTCSRCPGVKSRSTM